MQLLIMTFQAIKNKTKQNSEGPKEPTLKFHSFPSYTNADNVSLRIVSITLQY